MMNQSDLLTWFSERPHIEYVLPFVADINGVFRGKRVPASQVKKLIKNGLRMPLSSVNVDIWGRDIEDSPLVFESGDSDGKCFWTGRTPIVMTWDESKSALLPMSFFTETGKAFAGDPRNALKHLVSEFDGLKLRPVIAFELEFYLADPKAQDGSLVNPLSGAVKVHDGVLSIDEINDFSDFLNEIYDCCKLNDVSVDAVISESGFCQFEVNMKHSDDVLKAADDAVFFKTIVKSIARRRGIAATFMAKPFADRPGNGMHAHFSILDEHSQNIFDDGSETGTAIMRHCVGGIMANMKQSMLFFAPHLNSYRRMAPGQHAPTSILWGYENRTASVRIPGGAAADRRIEHRVAGADTNPYLVTMAILGAALHGIKDAIEPDDPVDGNCYAMTVDADRTLPTTWEDAIRLFEEGDRIAGCFSKAMHDMIMRTKKQESTVFAKKITPFEYQSYLEQV